MEIRDFFVLLHVEESIAWGGLLIPMREDKDVSAVVVKAGTGGSDIDGVGGVEDQGEGVPEGKEQTETEDHLEEGLGELN